MALAFTVRGRLIIVLDEENIERITHNDPFDFDARKVPHVLALGIPLRISICYATKAEQDKITAMRDDGEALLKYLARGFTVTDSDRERGDETYKPL